MRMPQAQYSGRSQPVRHAVVRKDKLRLSISALEKPTTTQKPHGVSPAQQPLAFHFARVTSWERLDCRAKPFHHREAVDI